MNDNSSDDRFSMPPAEDDAEQDNERAAGSRPGLTLPPPGLFARLEDPDDEVAPVADEPLPVPIDVVEPVDALEDHTAVLAADTDTDTDAEALELDDAPEAEPELEPESEPQSEVGAGAASGLVGVADAVEIIEQLTAQAEAEAGGPSGDDLVFAEASEAIAAAELGSVVAEPALDEEPAPDALDEEVAAEPAPLPSYAAVDFESPVDDATPEPVLPPIALPRYGDADRLDDDEEILPHFLLEESEPIDVVGAQDQLREMAQKNRQKVAVAEERPTLARTLAEIPILLVVAAVIAFLVKTFLAQAYYIPSGSMLPQLQIDDRVVVSKLAYKLHDPRRGDIVVFDDPNQSKSSAGDGDSNILRKIGEGVGVVQPSTDEFIKRVIALPGETVSGRDGYVYINGRKLIEPYLPNGVETDDFQEQTVAAGKLWVMGDNRNGSADSRVFGQIDIDSIVGRAVVRVWPLSHASFL